MLILSMINMLLSHLKNIKKISKFISTAFKTAIEISWTKLNYYYNFINLIFIYAIAVIFDSYIKFEYFKRNWSINWVTELKWKLKKMFKKKKSYENKYFNKCNERKRKERKNINDIKINIKS